MPRPSLPALARFVGRLVPIADRGGSVAVISAIVFSALLGFAALAIDATSWEETALRAQTAADQAAIAAGAASLQGETLTQYTVDAKGVAAKNGFSSANGATVTVSSPPASGAYAGDTGDIEVVVQQQANSFFRSSAPVVGAHAVVSANYGACIIVLGTTGQTFSMNGAMSTTLKKCDFYNNSSSNSGTYLNGAVSLSAENISLVGNYNACSVTCSIKATKSLITNAASAASDPYAGRTPPFPVGQSIPTSDCSYKNESLSGSGSFNFTDSSSSPTVFCGGLTASNIAGSIAFGSGTYVFDGNVNISGAVNITSSNATLVVTPGHSLSISGAANLQMTAPTTGSTAGMAIWIEENTSTNPVTSGNIGLTGASSVNITGVVYAPGGALTINGASGSQCTQLVASSINVTGAASLQHNCSGVGISDIGGLALIE